MAPNGVPVSANLTGKCTEWVIYSTNKVGAEWRHLYATPNNRKAFG